MLFGSACLLSSFLLPSFLPVLSPFSLLPSLLLSFSHPFSKGLQVIFSSLWPFRAAGFSKLSEGSSPTEELDKEARRRPAVTPRAPRPEDEPACWFPCFHPTLWMNASIMPTSPALPTCSPNSGVAHLPWKLCTPLPGGVETLEQLYELPSSG